MKTFRILFVPVVIVLLFFTMLFFMAISEKSEEETMPYYATQTLTRYDLMFHVWNKDQHVLLGTYKGKEVYTDNFKVYKCWLFEDEDDPNQLQDFEEVTNVLAISNSGDWQIEKETRFGIDGISGHSLGCNRIDILSEDGKVLETLLP